MTQTHDLENSEADYTPYPDDPVEMMADMLQRHALTLNDMYVDLFALGGEQLSTDPNRGERVTALALRAQANCRAALVAMAKAADAVKRAREQGGVPAISPAITSGPASAAPGAAI